MGYSKFLRWISLDKVSCPVLIVHNREDGCKSTPFSEASGMIKVFKNSPTVDFVGVNGGSYPRSGPCESLSPHGFLASTSEVVDKIVQWILNTKSPNSQMP